MDDKYSDVSYLRKMFSETEIVKKPLHRIISGYHTLPYILIGQSNQSPTGTTEIRGVIHVSPKMVFHPGEWGDTYGDIFGEMAVEPAIVARVFGFLYLKEQTTAFSCEDLTIQELPLPVPEALERALDELARRECLDTGVIQIPDVRIYPVSVDRYIREMLDKELAAGTVR